MNALLDAVRRTYPTSEFPILFDQFERWQQAPPLVGIRVLDATPPFRNTTAKYLPLLAAGAEVSVATDDAVPADEAVLRELSHYGISVVPARQAVSADVVLDCAGICAHVTSRFGYAELTRTGAHRYADTSARVLLVDAGEVKQLENEFGTGDGFVRALAHLGYPELMGKNFVVFGAGKVGRGIAGELVGRGAAVCVVDEPERASEVANVVAIGKDNHDAIADRIRAAWCVVSATGVVGALTEFADVLNRSHALLANMGVEDEFGADLPIDRVLFEKRPLNFVLPEPTRLRFIDPSFALSNQCAVELVNGRARAGVHPPAPQVEAAILARWRASTP